MFLRPLLLFFFLQFFAQLIPIEIALDEISFVDLNILCRVFLDSFLLLLIQILRTGKVLDFQSKLHIQTLHLDYAKQKWDKSHKVPDFKGWDLVLVSTLNFNNIKGPKKLEDLYVGPFVIVALHGTNAVQVKLSGELKNKHPTLPVSLIKPYQPADKELFRSRNPAPLILPPVEQSEDKRIKKVIKERRLRGKNQREYLVRYRNPVHEDEWLAKSEMPDSDKLL
ncbi:hypothetical protein O181_075341 [Austropuccinia psidii MF-1]|uniref:Tf2-1-like SH3-like domain-containing protein n=1 Tax=Austropuccinia psidii MF-1 TaxID=1389203 RepID=A0A9Q3FEG8_9BASI|nr:hypothetical protein [Austropuccinia psidii MF-1]